MTLIKKTLLAGGLKFSSAFVAFFLTLMVTRILGAEQAGLFLLGFSLLAFLSIFFRLGLDNVVLRLIGANGLSKLSQSKLNRGLTWVFITASLFTVGVVVFSDFISLYLFNNIDFSPILSWIILALPSMVLFMLLSLAFQGQRRVVSATMFQNLGVSSLFVIITTVFLYQFDVLISAIDSAKMYAVSALIICISAISLWFFQPGVRFTFESIKDNELLKASSNLWVSSIMSLAVIWSGVLVSSAFVTPSELAYLSAAQRTAMLISFILVVVNMVLAPLYARLWSEGNIGEMARLARLSTRTMILMGLPIIIIILLFPKLIMSLFGVGFEKGSGLLIIMAVGQFINVSTGSVNYLLNMTGHEKDFRKVTMFAGPLTLFLSYVLVLKFGIIGAAISTAIGLSLQNLLALHMVKKRLGFWPIG
jgi:O-antigen/teichoic acid export membrane protein